MKPNFLFVGLGKTGSTLMHRVIKRHPDIFLSPRAKELDFFSNLSNYDRGEEYYDSMFEGYTGERFVGDISPSYYSKSVYIDRIREFYRAGLPKVVLSVRHPLSQFYSRYVQVLKIGNYLNQNYVPGSFSYEFRRGIFFHDPLRGVKEVVERLGGAENILLLVYENDFTEPYDFEPKIYDFLGIDASEIFYNEKADASINVGLLPRLVPAKDMEWTLEADGHSIQVPANQALFCSTNRRTRAFGPGDEEYATILRHHQRQEHWLDGVEQEVEKLIHDKYVIPMRELLENRFNVDLSCWDDYTLPTYKFAPPEVKNVRRPKRKKQ